jgi:repressor LexA
MLLFNAPLPSKITNRQLQMLEVIARFCYERHYPPTWREIGSQLGIRSSNGVYCNLKLLWKKGFLDYEDHKCRSIRLIGVGYLPDPYKE